MEYITTTIPVCSSYHYNHHSVVMSVPNLRTAWISWSYVIVLLLSVFLVAGKSLRTPGPTILSNPTFVSHQEGEMAVLYCSVANLGHRTVAWRKLPSKALLTIATKRYIKDTRLHAEHVPNSSQWNLVIDPVRLGDRGEYECQVSYRKSLIRHKVTLHVTKKPEIQIPRIEISGENVIRAGTTLKLTCNATVGVEKLTWFKNRSPIHLDYRHNIYTSVSMTRQNTGFRTSILQVKNTRPSDGGAYVCRSTERTQMAGVTVEIQGNNNMKRDDSDDSPLRETRDYHQTHSSTKGNDSNNTATKVPITLQNINIMLVAFLYFIIFFV